MFLKDTLRTNHYPDTYSVKTLNTKRKIDNRRFPQKLLTLVSFFSFVRS